MANMLLKYTETAIIGIRGEKNHSKHQTPLEMLVKESLDHADEFEKLKGKTNE